MITQNYILLIMNCEKYRAKAISQKNGWLKNLPSYLIYYHCIGNPDLHTDFLFDEEERILYVKTKDDYNSLPHKVITSYQAIHSHYEYKYIFKTDDDQLLNNIRFFDMITGLLSRKEISTTEKYHYGGMIVDVQHPHISQYYRIHPELPTNIPIMPIKYCNGRFYLLSKEAVTYLIEKKAEIQSQYLEDYAIGYCLEDNNALFKSNILSLQTQNFFFDEIIESCR